MTGSCVILLMFNFFFVSIVTVVKFGFLVIVAGYGLDVNSSTAI